MSELQNIEADLHTLEEKIDAWFQKHFGAIAPDAEMHTAVAAAHDDLKVVMGITPPVSAHAEAPVPDPVTPVS